MTMLGRACIALLAVVALTGCGEIDRPVVVGAKDFAEQKITAQLLAQTLRAHEIPVEVDDTARTSLEAVGALWAGDIDLYVDYTGSILALSGHPPVDDPAASYAAAQEALEPFGLALGPLLGFRNDYAVLARPGSPAAARPATLSALADAQRLLRIGMTEEFRARPLDGYEPLLRRYGLRAEATLLVPSSPAGKDRLYATLLDGDIDLAVGFLTDPQLAELGLVALADDRGFFPAYAAAPLARAALLERRPAIADALSTLEDRVSTDAMRALVAEVTHLGTDPFDAVARFLDPTLPPATPGTLGRPFGIALGGLDATAGQAAEVVLGLRKAFPGRRIEVRRVANPLAPLLAGEVRYALVTGPELFTLDEARGRPERGDADALVPVGFDVLHLLVRPEGAAEVWGPDARLGVGPAAGVTARAATFVDAGIEAARPTLVPSEATGTAAFRAQAAQVRDGGLDGLLIMTEMGHPLIAELLASGLRLAPIDNWERRGNRVAFPFLQPVTLPADSYPGQNAALRTVGSQVVLAAARPDPADAVGVVGPGSAAIGQNLPVAAGAVARIREALDVAVRLDPSLPTATVAFQPPPERRDGIGLSPAGSLANLAVILIMALIVRLYLARPDRHTAHGPRRR
jgi:glycine betaine/choline ABC-type transport system substrate-binding protein